MLLLVSLFKFVLETFCKLKEFIARKLEDNWLNTDRQTDTVYLMSLVSFAGSLKLAAGVAQCRLYVVGASASYILLRT